MRVRQLSPSGDYTWGQSQLNFYVNVPAAVGQVCKTRLGLFSGEWYQNILLGTPYVTGALGFNSATTAATVTSQIDTVPGFVDISEYSSTIDDNGKNTIEMTINTEFGPTQVQQTNYRNY